MAFFLLHLLQQFYTLIYIPSSLKKEYCMYGTSYYMRLLCALVCFSSFTIYPKECCGGTFFKVRKTTTNNALQHNLSLYWWYHEVVAQKEDVWWTVQATPLYQQSNSGKKVAQYFFPCAKECISIKEDGTGDVGSLWLNLIAPQGESFDACLCMRPERRVAGTLLNLRVSLSRWLCNWWIDTAFAVIKASHTLNMCVDQRDGDGVACDIANVCQALQQPGWQVGKFYAHTRSNHGVDDLQLKLGHNIWFHGGNHLSPYVVTTIGLEKNQPQEYIFEPTVGSVNNAFGFGCIAEVGLCDWEHGHLAFLTDFKYRYVFSAIETRSMDLCKNGQWSRYLQVVAQDAPSQALPGINFFTRKLKVTPGNLIDWFMALHIEHKHLDVEVGYDFWYRQKEKIRLCACLPEGFGIYDMIGDCKIAPTSAHCAHISQSVIGENVPMSDPMFVQLQSQDLNVASAATPRAITNMIFGAVGYHGHLCGWPALFGVGAYYEAATNCAILSNWAVWAKCALAF